MGRRIFFSTGEASGEQIAVLLAEEMRRSEPDLHFEGFGDTRMARAGFTLWEHTTNWASLGPLAAIPRVPHFLRVLLSTAWRLRQNPPDLVILIDYGALHLRLARLLRAVAYRGPILYAFPPSAWRDRPEIAQQVAAVATPLIPFERQAALYQSLGLVHEALGHPLGEALPSRPPRALAPTLGGRIVLMPGSRTQEVTYILPRMLAALELLHAKRPQIEVRILAAEAGFVPRLSAAVAAYPWINIVIGSHDHLLDADVALVKSGTAVLETALLGVPTVAVYVVSPALAWIVRNVMGFRVGFVTLPNLILSRAVVPERLQEAATPSRIAADLDELLGNPHVQSAGFEEMRARLGGVGALKRWGELALRLARLE